MPKNRTETFPAIHPYAQGIGLTVITLALSASCGANTNHYIEANQPAVVENKYDTFEQNGSGFGGNWSPVFTLVVEQCDRPDDPSADANDCITLAVEVSESTYDAFNPGEEVFFIQDMPGVVRDTSRPN